MRSTRCARRDVEVDRVVAGAISLSALIQTVRIVEHLQNPSCNVTPLPPLFNLNQWFSTTVLRASCGPQAPFVRP